MTEHDDRARDERQAANELAALSQEMGLYDDDRARDEPTAAAAHGRFAPEELCATCGSGDVFENAECDDPYHAAAWPDVTVEQPAPTVRETVADELAEAPPPEVWWSPTRGPIEHVGNIGDEGVYRHQTANGPAETNRLPADAVALVLAPSVEWCEEMAELRRERDAARAEAERLRPAIDHYLGALEASRAEVLRLGARVAELEPIEQRAHEVASGAVTPPGSQESGVVVLKRAAARYILGEGERS